MAKAKIGIVISTKTPKTLVVAVQSVRAHPLYFKSVRKTKNFHVHDELSAKLGDKVGFIETRPLSKTVRWITTKLVTTDSNKKAAGMTSPKVISEKAVIKPKKVPRKSPRQSI